MLLKGYTPRVKRNMLVRRLTAYGEKWKAWANTRVNTARLSVIPQKFRDRQVIRQEADGEYALNGAIQDWIDRIP